MEDGFAKVYKKKKKGDLTVSTLSLREAIDADDVDTLGLLIDEARAKKVKHSCAKLLLEAFYWGSVRCFDYLLERVKDGAVKIDKRYFISRIMRAKETKVCAMLPKMVPKIERSEEARDALVFLGDVFPSTRSHIEYWTESFL
mgnify:CR=1 FL=1